MLKNINKRLKNCKNVKKNRWKTHSNINYQLERAHFCEQTLEKSKKIVNKQLTNIPEIDEKPPIWK